MASSVCPVSRTDSDHNIGWHIFFMGPDERIMGKNDKQQSANYGYISADVLFYCAFIFHFSAFELFP